MLIDWFTVGAQGLNFVLLVWLMKRFLYQPILRAIDARERRIAAELADAAAKQAEARKERDEFEHKSEVFDRDRATMLERATLDAKVERARLLEEARRATDASNAARVRALRVEARDLGRAVRLRMEREVFAVARKALSDLATTTLEERMAEVFVRRLSSLEGQTKARLVAALRTASSPAILRSAFELTDAQRATVRGALNETFSTELDVRFETAPELIAGLELATNGQKVAWSIEGYLTSLAQDIDGLLGHADGSDIRVEVKPTLDARAETERL